MWPIWLVGMLLSGMWIARRPALWAPQTSSKSRSPTYTQRLGSLAPTAAIAASNARGDGFVHGISLV